METLRTALVTYKGKRAGILAEHSGSGSIFTYDEDAPEIACALPRNENTHITNVGIHPFFSNLAPEGWLRDRQETIADTAEEDDFGLLLAFGSDCIGAVGIDPTDGIRPNINLHTALDAETQAIAQNRRTISGVQAKLLCVKSGRSYLPAATDGPAPYIAKFAREGLPDLVGNEEAALKLTKYLLPKDEINQAKRGLVKNIEQPGLIVKRFDRFYDGDAETKLRCEDFAQVLGMPSGRDRKNKYNVDYEALFEALQHSENPTLDAFILFKRLIAFDIIGNTDCHLKNWSLVETSLGLRLSPIYDVLNSYIYGGQGYSTVFGLQLDGQRLQWQAYTKEVLEGIGKRLRLTDSAINLAFTDIKGRKKQLAKGLKAGLQLGEDRLHQFRATIEEKWSQIYD